jgi:hypothetical protein
LVTTNALWLAFAFSMARLQAERDQAAADERRELANRIQAPQAAPYLPIEGRSAPPVPYDDDDAYWEAQKAVTSG